VEHDHGHHHDMVEWDAIENWLQLELEASVLTASQGLEVPADLLVKKPFKLGRCAESRDVGLPVHPPAEIERARGDVLCSSHVASGASCPVGPRK
jgi:hypothetical protein